MSAVAERLSESVRDRVSEEEWAARIDLAAAYRLVAHHGWDDLIFTHLSARVPGPQHHFLLNPLELMFDEITASSLIKVDEQGDKVGESPWTVGKAAFVIHSAIHMGRPDARAVLHLHTPYGQAVSAMTEGLMPLTQTAMVARHQLANHEYEGLATDMDERERLVEDLGAKHTMLLHNHGTLAIGETVGEAFLRMYFLERACEAQVHALAAGRDGVSNPPQGTPDKVALQTSVERTKQTADRLAWPALLRKLDRLGSDHAR